MQPNFSDKVLKWLEKARKGLELWPGVEVVTEDALRVPKLSLPPSKQPSGFLISLTRCEVDGGEE